MKKLRFFAACALALALALPCRAADAPQEELTGENRWLFQLEAEASPGEPETGDGIETVSAGQGVYAAETLADAFGFAGVENIACLARNSTVSLLETPNDPLYQSGAQWDRAILQADSAWEQGITGAGVRIGIVDSGIYRKHEDLQGASILQGYDYVEDDTDPQDTQGHGTFVAGIIAAQVNNGLGVAGIAPGAEIVPLKCFSNRETDLEFVLKAIYGGVDDFHCDILNLSLGAEEETELMHNAVRYADSKGVLIAAAAGNDGKDGDTPDPLNWPAAYEEVIGVGSINRNQVHSPFSQKNESVWIVAPGSYIRGLGYTGADKYLTSSGTSYATPCVTSLLALVLERYPGLDRKKAMAALEDSAKDLGEPGWDNQYGWGLVTATGLLDYFSNPFPRMTAQVENGEVTVETAYPRSMDLKGAVSIAVTYDGSGQMLSITQASPKAGETLSLSLPADQAARVKVFTIKGDSVAPVCEAREAEMEEGN